jgi:hypothetical protein
MSSVADETTSGSTAPRDSGSKAPTDAEENGGRAGRPRRRPRVSAKQVAHGAKVGSDAVRVRVASIVGIVAVVCGVILALGAILAALHDYVNPGNLVVETIRSMGNVIAGPFGDIDDAGKFQGGVFDLSTTAKDALANWGAAAVVYLVAGRIVSRVIHP